MARAFLSSDHMELTLESLFGSDRDLSPSQMSLRAVVVSLYCLVLFRFSGRRSFALGTPIDNVLAILLGAILSRAVTGASPMLATLCAGATIAFLHRACSWLAMYSRCVGKVFKGEARIVYHKGKLIEKNMRYCRITRRDLMAGIRLSVHRNNFDGIRSIYVERNGRISVVEDEKPRSA